MGYSRPKFKIYAFAPKCIRNAAVNPFLYYLFLLKRRRLAIYNVMTLQQNFYMFARFLKFACIDKINPIIVDYVSIYHLPLDVFTHKYALPSTTLVAASLKQKKLNVIIRDQHIFFEFIISRGSTVFRIYLAKLFRWMWFSTTLLFIFGDSVDARSQNFFLKSNTFIVNCGSLRRSYRGTNFVLPATIGDMECFVFYLRFLLIYAKNFLHLVSKARSSFGQKRFLLLERNKLQSNLKVQFQNNNFYKILQVLHFKKRRWKFIWANYLLKRSKYWRWRCKLGWNLRRFYSLQFLRFKGRRFWVFRRKRWWSDVFLTKRLGKIFFLLSQKERLVFIRWCQNKFLRQSIKFLQILSDSRVANVVLREMPQEVLRGTVVKNVSLFKKYGCTAFHTEKSKKKEKVVDARFRRNFRRIPAFQHFKKIKYSILKFGARVKNRGSNSSFYKLFGRNVVKGKNFNRADQQVFFSLSKDYSFSNFYKKKKVVTELSKRDYLVKKRGHQFLVRRKLSGGVGMQVMETVREAVYRCKKELEE